MTVILRRWFNMIYTSPDKTVTVVHVGGAAISKLFGQAAEVNVK